MGLGQERLFNIPGADRVLSPSLPRRGNWLARAVGRLSYKLTGWRVEGQLPDVPKLVLVGAPHTSYWDAPLAIGFFFATGLDCRWMAKKEAFKQPLGGLIRRMGAIPVNRQDPGNLVQQVIDEMNRSEKFVLIITPEGSRTKGRALEDRLLPHRPRDRHAHHPRLRRLCTAGRGYRSDIPTDRRYRNADRRDAGLLPWDHRPKSGLGLN